MTEAPKEMPAPAPDVAPWAVPAALGSSRAGPGSALAGPGAGFGFSGFAGFFGSGIAFADGRIFSDGFSMTGLALTGAGRGSLGAATGAGAGAASGRPSDAGLTTRTGRDHGEEDLCLGGAAHEEKHREEGRVREDGNGCRQTAGRAAAVRAPLENVRNGQRPGKGGRRRPHLAPSLLSSVTMPRLSTPSRFNVSMVSTTTPYARLRSAFRYTALSRRRERMS